MTAMPEMSRMRKTALLIVLVLLLSVAPLAAQDNLSTAVDWVPATFDSLIRVDLNDNSADGYMTLDDLNLATFIAARLQPTRLPYARPTYSTIFPLGILDAEKATFENTILPWIDGNVVLAYRNFGSKLNVADADRLMVLPTSDTFAAAGLMSAVIKAQDFPRRDSYRDASLFIGDRTTIGFTPGAVLIGSEADVRAAVDAQAGAGARLVDTPAYKTVSAALPAHDFLFAYVNGAQSLRAVSVLLNGNDSGMGLLSALGSVISSAQASTLEAQFLTGAVKGIGVSISADNRNRTLHAQAAVYADSKPVAAKFDPSVLQVLPRSAMFVQSGADGHSAFNDALRLLPLSSYVSNVLGGFFPALPNAPVPPPAPTEADIRSSVESFVSAFKSVGGFDLDSDLAAHLGGSYALAVIPRPNDPTPLTGAPFDVLIAARVTDGEAAVKGVTTLAQIALGLPAASFQPTQIEGASFNSAVIPATGETLFAVGSVDNLLIAGTGDAAVEAMRARKGDNQLIKVDRWQNVTGDSPLLYVDLNAVYNLQLGTAGATTPPTIGQLGIDIQDGGNGVTILDLLANVPTD